MFSVQNLHGPMLWGFFFACPLVPSADVRGLSVDRSHHVSYLCDPSIRTLPYKGDVAGTYTAAEHPQACACPRWVAMCRMTRMN